ncbi:MAG: SAM-dependent methyltransferase [Flavobacteriales bacterium]|nr:SAM-dependent methyltransferase [Flavobacteriales bacterium]
MEEDTNNSSFKTQNTKFPKGKLYLIPCGLGGENEFEILPAQTLEIARNLSEFIVEREKTARHFLKRIGLKIPQNDLILHDMGKHAENQQFNQFLASCKAGKDIGVISEAGCPGVADPGAEIVKLAHEAGIEVVPLVGPSSILMALMASGMNGQSFAFHGYLPIDKGQRNQFIKMMENNAQRRNQQTTQIFMETPFRNNQLLEELLRTCHPNTQLCIACEISLPKGFCKTKSISDWKKAKVDLHKKPTIFLMF